MSGRPPRACRLLIAAAGRIVPRALRPEWRHRWDRDAWNWWAFLAEHGAFDRRARAELIRHCWGAFPDAVGTRLDVGPRIAHFLRSPQFCLLLAFMPLAAMAIFSHGFSGVRAVATPLPYRDAKRVGVLAFHEPLRIQAFAPASLEAWRKAVRLEGLAAFQVGKARLEQRDVRAARVEPGFFSLLGVDPAMGHFLRPEDRNAAVLSYAAWKRLARSNTTNGKATVMLDGRPLRVAGVLPPGFWSFRRDIEIWTTLDPPAEAGADARFGALVRLKPFAHERDTAQELSWIAWEQPGREGVWVQVLPLADRLRSAGRWCGGLSCLAIAAACLLALLGFSRNPRCALFLVAKALLLIAGLALAAIELPAAAYGAASAGRGLMVEPLFLLASCGAVWWAWRDQRRRCRVCLHRLTLPVHFGNLGSPLLERTGMELVC